MLALLLFTSLSHAFSLFFFFNDTATTEIYTLSLHDALPISRSSRTTAERLVAVRSLARVHHCAPPRSARQDGRGRSEEHTSELQSQSNLVCRLLLEKKKKNIKYDKCILCEYHSVPRRHTTAH